MYRSFYNKINGFNSQKVAISPFRGVSDCVTVHVGSDMKSIIIDKSKGERIGVIRFLFSISIPFSRLIKLLDFPLNLIIATCQAQKTIL